MPVPKRKTSKRRRDQRSANKGIQAKAFTECSSCQAPINPHVMCSNCGTYKGKKVAVTKVERMIKRGETRQAMAKKAQERAQASQQVENQQEESTK